MGVLGTLKGAQCHQTRILPDSKDLRSDQELVSIYKYILPYLLTCCTSGHGAGCYNQSKQIADQPHQMGVQIRLPPVNVGSNQVLIKEMKKVCLRAYSHPAL